ncbi:TIGR03086 family metal-binding protein [Pseudonocardia ailaonensis]|uniref:TIGR03086 family metal-binding protein n=1 Tax=Pseudonocardia ailaonensis TaxID=367279 RepID=A0ABN2NIF9_9PSEU
MTTTEIDPRTVYAGALDWAATVVGGVREDQRGLPTPCPEFDVDGLTRHLVGTVHKIALIGAGTQDPQALPATIGPDEDPLAELAAAREDMEGIWAAADVLEREVAAPWGRTPGRLALWGYVNELLVHTWDVAVSTGQHAEGPAEGSELALAIATTLVPAEREGFPFAPPVAPAVDAGPTERLANWSGHSR